jgi:hypothetical protein
MDTSKFSFQYRATGPGLAVAVFVDGQQKSSQLATDEFVTFEYDIPDDDTTHAIEVQLLGKTDDHTVLDDQGNIISDRVVEIANIMLDDMDSTDLLIKRATYIHNFNGNGDTIADEFYGIMGCNGTVRFEFSTPVYIWLLENM